MKQIFTIIALMISFNSYSQIIEFTYDDAGNRTKREIVSNTSPPPNDNNSLADQKNEEIPESDLESDETNSDVESSSNQSAPKIFPNPTNSSLEINLGFLYNLDKSQTLEILDLNGKIIQDLPVNKSIAMLKLDGYRSGMYYLHFKEEGVIKGSWKIIKVD